LTNGFLIRHKIYHVSHFSSLDIFYLGYKTIWSLICWLFCILNIIIIQSELKLQTIFGTVPSIFSCSSVKRLMQTSMFVHRHFVFLITTSDPLTLGYFKRFLLLFNRCGPISCDCLPYHVSVVTHFGDFFLKFYANVMMLLKSVIPNLDGHYVVQWANRKWCLNLRSIWKHIMSQLIGLSYGILLKVDVLVLFKVNCF